MEYIPESIARYLVGYQSDGNNLRTSSAAFVYHFKCDSGLGIYLKINAQPDVVNVLVENGVLTGFVDWGYAGVGDRWIDIVACVHSVRRNLGEEWETVFLKQYGVGEMDVEREAYYNKVLVS